MVNVKESIEQYLKSNPNTPEAKKIISDLQELEKLEKTKSNLENSRKHVIETDQTYTEDYKDICKKISQLKMGISHYYHRNINSN